MMKKFKLRFSYFLIAGMIGIILQVIAFFLWKNTSLSVSNLVSTTNSTYLTDFVLSTYIGLFACIFLAIMAFGFIKVSTKKSIYIRFGSYLLGISQLLLCVVDIVYLILVSILRTTMYSNKTCSTTIDVLVAIKYFVIFISCISFLLISIGLLEINNHEKIRKVGSIGCLICNCVCIISLLLVLILAFTNSSFNLLNKFYEMSKVLSLPYTSKYGFMNGFTFGQLKRIFVLIEEISTTNSTANFSNLYASCIIAVIGIFSYLLTLVGNLFFITSEIILSFDVNKDEKPMTL